MAFVNPLPSFSLNRCHHIVTRALADWATLSIDSSGTTIKTWEFEHLKSKLDNVERLFRPQDEEQEQCWYTNMSQCYRFLHVLANDYDVTFFAQSIDESRAYLKSVNTQSYTQPYPYDKARYWHTGSSPEEQLVIGSLVEPMLNHQEEQAFYFMKCVIVDWLARLDGPELYQTRVAWPTNHQRGYVLYYMMIEFEH